MDSDERFVPREGTSLQERLFGDMTCFGCGPANPKGLRLRSHDVPVDGGSEVRALFRPWVEHDNGGGFLNGGIIATVLDCHSAAAVQLSARQHGWSAPPGGLAFVTAGLEVAFRRPTPLDEELRLVAEVVSASESEITAVARLEHGGKVRATGESVWKRWRPRS